MYIFLARGPFGLPPGEFGKSTICTTYGVKATLHDRFLLGYTSCDKSPLGPVPAETPPRGPANSWTCDSAPRRYLLSCPSLPAFLIWGLSSASGLKLRRVNVGNCCTHLFPQPGSPHRCVDSGVYFHTIALVTIDRERCRAWGSSDGPKLPALSPLESNLLSPRYI
jgi:hypothetical protein